MTDKINSEETQRILGKDAQRNNILAARVLAETVKTTLGPKGMDKMLVDRAGDVIVTNDGATILKEMEIEHPAAKMIVEIAKTQEEEIGDGTTTAVMLAGKFLENAEKLLDKKIHPTIITRGFRLAMIESLKILDELSFEINSKEELMKIAQTAMTGKGVEFLKEKFSEIVVDAIEIVAKEGKVELDDIKIEKQKGNSLEDSELIKGIVLDKGRASSQMPKKIESARIALIEEPLEIKNPEAEARISVSTPEQLQRFLSHEEEILKSKVDKIIESGANVVFVQRGIDELIRFYLSKKNIYAVERVSKDDLEALSKSTGAKIVSKLNELSHEDLGKSELVEERKEADESFTYVLGCHNPRSVTILIRGGSEHLLDEAQRAIMDGLGDVSATLMDSKVVAGGGAIEMELAKRLSEFATTLKGRERLAVEKYSESFEFIPAALSENAGLDSIDVLTELRALHDNGQKNHGINLLNSKIEDTLLAGIIEPKKVKRQAITSATEVATMILRIDDIIASKKIKDSGVSLESLKGYD